ncbi:tetratricopeptide repeat protein [Pseudomonas botevensis]|uniref:tetratricopeptide repeat protein n=1 Tax=Pseudomonas botevensis TaxID=2842352 RepID=UPI001C3CC8A2|nr:sel1 repeat family protein [Pseudomonas botevensis]MBV4476974.1 sel1 repeat family protein [Pseudomonas botevensis]
MNKVVAVLSLTALIAGCKPFGGPNPIAVEYPIFHCFPYLERTSLSELELDDLRYYARRDNGCKMVLGKIYEFGRAVPQDIPRAKDIYLSVAEDDPQAYGRLGVMAEEGIGGPVDLVAARDFYQRAVAKPGNTDIELKLAQYMEEGKGGPQDLQGALTHYFNASTAGGETSWKGLERLRDKGVVMTIEQQQRYNNVFVSRVKVGLRLKMKGIEKAFEKVITPATAGKTIQVQLEYSPGSLVPAISLRESSGNKDFDQQALQGFSDYRFPGVPILPPEQKTYQAIAMVRTDGKTPMQRFRDERAAAKNN